MNNNEPAFPHEKGKEVFGQTSQHYHGMCLRDYFASKAMQGIMSNSSRRIQEIYAIVSDAYDVADAMLKRREI